MYCGDDHCNCGAREEMDLIGNSNHLTLKELVDRINDMRAAEARSA